VAPYLERWRTFDAFDGRAVRLFSGGRTTDGVYAGIAPNGALILENGEGRSEHHAGEVSLRAAEAN
jgi:BirA family biotin operon repressor/biotin-[acetyl-CoA-carboxylase] ligase